MRAVGVRQRLQPPGMHADVIIDEGDGLAPGRPDSRIPRGARALPALEDVPHYLPRPRGVPVDERAGPVGRVVVHDDDLIRHIRLLGQQIVQGGGEQPVAVVRGDDYREHAPPPAALARGITSSCCGTADWSSSLALRVLPRWAGRTGPPNNICCRYPNRTHTASSCSTPRRLFPEA